MVYNLSGIASNSTTVLDLVQGVNENLLMGYGGLIFLLGVSVVFFLSFFFSTRDAVKSMAATSFLFFAFCVLFRAMELINNKILLASLIILGFALAFSGKRSP